MNLRKLKNKRQESKKAEEALEWLKNVIFNTEPPKVIPRRKRKKDKRREP